MTQPPVNGLTGGDLTAPLRSFQPAAKAGEGEEESRAPPPFLLLAAAAAVVGQFEADPDPNTPSPPPPAPPSSKAPLDEEDGALLLAWTGELPNRETPVDWAVVLAMREKKHQQ